MDTLPLISNQRTKSYTVVTIKMGLGPNTIAGAGGWLGGLAHNGSGFRHRKDGADRTPGQYVRRFFKRNENVLVLPNDLM